MRSTTALYIIKKNICSSSFRGWELGQPNFLRRNCSVSNDSILSTSLGVQVRNLGRMASPSSTSRSQSAAAFSASSLRATFSSSSSVAKFGQGGMPTRAHVRHSGAEAFLGALGGFPREKMGASLGELMLSCVDPLRCCRLYTPRSGDVALRLAEDVALALVENYRLITMIGENCSPVGS